MIMDETVYTVCLIIVCVIVWIQAGFSIYFLIRAICDSIYSRSYKPVIPSFTLTLTKRIPESDVNDNTVAGDDGENDKINKSE
jgi:hypothetical protein